MLSERLFEDILVKYPELIEDSLVLIGRQVTYFGKRIDILFHDQFQEKLVVEIKKDNLTRNALSQVLEYEGYILSEKDPTARVMLIANRIPLNLKKSMDHHGIEYKEITNRKLLDFLKKKDNDLFEKMASSNTVEKIGSDSRSDTMNQTMASKLDEILHNGGTWEGLTMQANLESKKVHGKTIYTVGTLRAHIKFRRETQKKVGYLKDRIITPRGIFPNDQVSETKTEIIGTVTNVKSKKDKNDRFEIWFSRSYEYLFPYGPTKTPEGIPIKIKLADKIYPIGFHNTKTLIWLSSRIDRNGYSLTDLLKSHGINNRERLLLTPMEDDVWEVNRAAETPQYSEEIKSLTNSRRAMIVDLITRGLSDNEILERLDEAYPQGHFITSNKQALYGTKRDLGF